MFRYLVLILTLLLPSAARPDVIVGTNVENPQWLAPAKQDAILGQLSMAGVRAIRIPLSPTMGDDYEATYRFIEGAARIGIGVHLVIWPRYPPDVKLRPASGPGTWPQPPLSAADPEGLRKFSRTVFERLDRTGVKLSGIEFDNEINWAPFNGDLPVPGRSEVLNLADLRDDPTGRAVAAGFDVYLQSLAALKAARDESLVNRRTPIVSAGLADPGSRRKLANGFEAVTIGGTLAYLRARGLDDLVDAYGVHTYAGPEIGARDLENYLRLFVLAACRPPGRSDGKPCWLTEWGVPLPSTSCPPADLQRSAAVSIIRESLVRFAREGLLGGTFYYAWDGEAETLGIYLCTSLTESGRIALSPISEAE